MSSDRKGLENKGRLGPFGSCFKMKRRRIDGCHIFTFNLIKLSMHISIQKKKLEIMVQFTKIKNSKNIYLTSVNPETPLGGAVYLIPVNWGTSIGAKPTSSL